MSANDTFKDKRVSPLARLSNIVRQVAGAREHVVLLVTALLVFLVLVCASGFAMLKSLKLGAYAAAQIGREFYVIVAIWFAVSFFLAMIAVRVSLTLCERVSGPIRRMERLLDKLLEKEDAIIVLREKDALASIAGKINRLKERQKNRS